MLVRSLILSLVVASQLTLWSADWPQWRGPNRDGKSTEKGLLRKWPANGPRKLWTLKGLGEGYSTVAVADGNIFTTGMEDGMGKLYVISTSGKIRGRKTYGKETKGGGYPGPRSTPTVVDGRVYLMSGAGVAVLLPCQERQHSLAEGHVRRTGGAPDRLECRGVRAG